jgi:hypothetical protein
MSKRPVSILMWMVGVPALWLVVAPDQLTWTIVVGLVLLPLLVYGVVRWVGKTPRRPVAEELDEIEEPLLPASAAAPSGEITLGPAFDLRPPGSRPR